MALKDKKKTPEVKQAELIKEQISQNTYAGSAEDLLKVMQQEISPEATPLWQYINDNAPKIAAIVITLIVLIGGYTFYSGYREGKVEDAKSQLALIISKKDTAQVLADLEQFKNSVESEVRLAVELEIARFASEQGDFAKAEDAYRYVMQKEKYSALGITAAMNTAGISAHQGNYAEAVKIYEDIVSHCPKDVQSLVYFQLGEMAEQSGDTDKAIKAYQDGINLFEDRNATDVVFYQARINELSK
jgi:predicted negative regulator of RcsB-dependent stress response